MTTWAAHLAARSRTWALGVRIEGVGPITGVTGALLTEGDGTGRYFFGLAESSDLPALARPYLVAPPDQLSERTPEGGGLPETGGLSFQILDKDLLLTRLLRLNAPAATSMFSATTATATAASVNDASGLAIGDVIYIGSEALLITGIAGNVLAVTRGWQGTTAAVHEEGDPVFIYLPTIKGRRVELVAGPADTPYNWRKLGEYVIEGVSWDAGLSAWSFEAGAQARYLDRRLPLRPPEGYYSSEAGEKFVDESFYIPVGSSIWGTTESDPIYVVVRDSDAQVLSLKPRASPSFGGDVIGRGLLGSSNDPPGAYKAGDIKRIVGPLDFRWSVTGSTSRASGFEPSTHFVDILLNILTSSAAEDDGLELTNVCTDTGYNWSSLWVGFGLGVPAARISSRSFVRVRERTPGWVFDWFSIGMSVTTGRELVRQILEATGCAISTDTGLLTLRLSRPALPDEATVALGVDDVLQSSGSPRWAPALELGAEVSQISYELGGGTTRVFAAGDFGLAARQYDRELFSREIKAPGIDPRTSGWLDGPAMGLLWRGTRSRVSLSADLDVGRWDDIEPGTLVSVALPLPTLVDGERSGTQSMVATEREFAPAPDDFHIRAKLVGYASGRFGRVAPSACIASATGTTTRVLTVTTNRYTPASTFLGIPAADSTAFTVGDQIQFINPDGSLYASTVVEVTAVSATTISVDDPSITNANLVGLIVVYAEHDASTSPGATQRGGYAAHAQRTNLEMPTSGDQAWQYGSP